MAPTTPTGAPSTAVAGDSWRWRIADLADYPQAEGWSLKYRILGKSRLSTDVSPTFQSSGDDAQHWLVTIPLADTAALLPGRYRLIARMVGSGAYAGREETVADSVLTVQPDPRTAAAGELQTHAEKLLALVESEIEARLTGTGSAHEGYTIEGRAITKIPLTELTRLRAKYASAVRQERSGRVGRRVEAVFTRASA